MPAALALPGAAGRGCVRCAAGGALAARLLPVAGPALPGALGCRCGGGRMSGMGNACRAHDVALVQLPAWHARPNTCCRCLRAAYRAWQLPLPSWVPSMSSTTRPAGCATPAGAWAAAAVHKCGHVLEPTCAGSIPWCSPHSCIMPAVWSARWCKHHPPADLTADMMGGTEVCWCSWGSGSWATCRWGSLMRRWRGRRRRCERAGSRATECAVRTEKLQT